MKENDKESVKITVSKETRKKLTLLAALLETTKQEAADVAISEKLSEVKNIK